MNNYRLRYETLNASGTTNDLRLNVPINITWDLNGVNESIDVYEDEIIQQSVNPIQDVETTRFSHKEYPVGINGFYKTSTNYNFYFYSALTDSSITATTNNERWVIDYRANGITDRQIYYYDNVFSKSFFKLDFYDIKKTTRQQILLTVIIPTQQGETLNTTIGQKTVKIKKPKFTLNHSGDKEGYYYYWLKTKSFLDIDTLYMSCKFYDANIGQFKRMMNVPQGTLTNKFNFSQENYFYYTVKFDYQTYTYEIFLDNETNKMVKVGTEDSPINWYEYVNP